MKYKKTILKNGLRLVTVPMADNPTVTALIMVEAGARYETPAENGISHFLEHMCFKGTENRTCSEIAFQFDSIGANYNAFTGQEYTGYYAKTHHKHLPKIVDILADMYVNSNFPEEELEKERGVITEEINMYEDLPQRKVYDEFTTLLYGSQPMGKTILGPKENIKKFTRKDFLDYREKYYHAAATTLVIAGKIEHKEALQLAKKYFDALSKKKVIKPVRVKENQKNAALRTFNKKTDQSHMFLGFRTFDMYKKDKIILEVLNSLLGDGMSSRLFSKMREELGICYYIKSHTSFSLDSGYLAIRSGVGNKRLEEAVTGIISELQKVKNEKVDKKELDKVKNMMISELVMHMETSNQHADFYAEQELFHQEIKNPKDLVKEIRAVTPEQIQKMAQKIFTEKNMNLAVIGPAAATKNAKKLLKI